MGRLVTIVWCSLVLLGTLTLGGCDDGKSAVLAQYKAGEKAIAERNAVDYRSIMSTGSFQKLEETLRLACEATPEQTKKLPCDRMAMVLALRNRVQPAKLKGMSVDDLISWQMKEGFLIVDADIGLVPYKVTITGDRAKMQYGLKSEAATEPRVRVGRRGIFSTGSRSRSAVEPIPDAFIYFERVNGTWYHDDTVEDPSYDEEIAAEAKEARKSVPEYMAQLEKEAHGTISMQVWSPPQ